MIVYAITNLVNGKRYIGMTEQSLRLRWSQHKKVAAAGVDTAIHHAIRKYGSENFKIEPLASILPSMGRKTLCEIERVIIAQEGTMSPAGYNLTPGGDGLPKGETNPNFGRKSTETKREKLRAAWTPERRAQAAKTMFETRCRPEVDKKIRAANSSEEARAKGRASWTPERRAEAAVRMVSNRRKYKESPEAKDARIERFIAPSRTADFKKAASERMKTFRAQHPELNASHSVWMKKQWDAKRGVVQ